uniref:RRM domain-containing protein n=1 Tax=Daucus carota subsp. sativus TaxID=79200 RepID=A0A161XZA6_DAUCS
MLSHVYYSCIVSAAQWALENEHYLGNRILEVKVATPKEEMRPPPSKKVTRIFVARIPPSVREGTFTSYFERYGEITDLYMPKDISAKGHRGIGFITFENAESVDDLMAETHELGGPTIVVDRATPKAITDINYDFKPVCRVPQGRYGAYNSYIFATRYAALGAPTMYDRPDSMYSSKPTYDVYSCIQCCLWACNFLTFCLNKKDVYVPKDPRRSGHSGFGFVTFDEDGVAERVSRRQHEICGQQVAIDTATPGEDFSQRRNFPVDEPESFLGYGGPMRAYGSAYGRMYGSLDFNDWSGYGIGGGRPSRANMRYMPYWVISFDGQGLGSKAKFQVHVLLDSWTSFMLDFLKVQQGS